MSKKSAKSENHKLPKGYGAGIKRLKNKSILGEERKVQLNLTLSPTAKKCLKAFARTQGVSMSELVEQWARRISSQDSVEGGDTVNNPRNNPQSLLKTKNETMRR